MRRTGLDWISATLLYCALATAIGFVDFRLPVHGERSYSEVTPAIAGGRGEPPGSYRVLAPILYEKFVQVTALPRETGWIVFRWLSLLAAFLAGHLFYRRWFSHGEAVAGNLFVAALLPLAFTNTWAHPDQFLELGLFSAGCACIVRRWHRAFIVVVAIAAFNRETSALLVLVYALAGSFNAERMRWTAAAAAAWAAVYAGLRWRYGFVPYDAMQLGHNLNFLFGTRDQAWFFFAHDRDLYSRIYPWFFLGLLAIPAAVIVRAWSVQPRFMRASIGIVAPAFFLVCFVFSSIIEPRIFTPLLPLLAAGVLCAAFPFSESEAAST